MPIDDLKVCEESKSYRLAGSHIDIVKTIMSDGVWVKVIARGMNCNGKEYPDTEIELSSSRWDDVIRALWEILGYNSELPVEDGGEEQI